MTKLKIHNIRKIIYSKYNQGFRLGCFTASSKGNTLLNCLNLKKKIIQFASENNKKKIGKYTPGTHIKIISDKDFFAFPAYKVVNDKTRYNNSCI